MSFVSLGWVRRCVAVMVAGLVMAGCGGSGDDDDAPDEASFCRLVDRYRPVAEAPLPVLVRLDELAPDEIDDAVVTLREAAEELDGHRPGSPELVEAEFEVRFRDDHIAARRQVDSYVRSTCRQAAPTTVATPTDGSKTDGGDQTGDSPTGENPTGEPSKEEPDGPED